jgi:hypothetical protein
LTCTPAFCLAISASASRRPTSSSSRMYVSMLMLSRAAAISRTSSRTCSGRPEQRDAVADDERAVRDRLLEREVAREDVAAAAVPSLGDDLAAALGREDVAVRRLQLHARLVDARHVGRDHRQRAAAGERDCRCCASAHQPALHRRHRQAHLVSVGKQHRRSLTRRRAHAPSRSRASGRGR